MTAPPTQTTRTIVYIDGFNLYYGAIAQTPYRWLDLQRLCQLLRPAESIVRIWYFTALISGPTKPHQESYLKAMTARPLVQPVFGNFKMKSIECHHSSCPGNARRYFQTHEEKRTDVNIALQMLDDGYRNLGDRMVLISGDSDMVPAIDLVGQRFPNIATNVYIPVPSSSPRGARQRSYKRELRNVATSVRELPNQLLQHSQLPDPITALDGTLVSKPVDWHGPKGPRPQRTAPPIPVGQCQWCGKA